MCFIFVFFFPKQAKKKKKKKIKIIGFGLKQNPAASLAESRIIGKHPIRIGLMKCNVETILVVGGGESLHC